MRVLRGVTVLIERSFKSGFADVAKASVFVLEDAEGAHEVFPALLDAGDTADSLFELVEADVGSRAA